MTQLICTRTVVAILRFSPWAEIELNMFFLPFYIADKQQQVRSSLAELELQAAQAIQRLESLKVDKVQETSHGGQVAAQPPPISTAGLLTGERNSTADVLSFLETVIVANSTDPDDADELDGNDPEYLLPALNDVSHLTLISHSIIAYLSHLDYRKLQRITTKISGDTNRWLAHLFRFVDANASYHTDSTDAILKAIR